VAGGKRSNVHVTPREDGWAVKREGAQRATTVVRTQAEAARIARDIARNEQGETLIHGRNNLIRERNSYGNDTFPPEG
jgi:hypothetical protein